MRIMPEAKRFLSQFGLRSFVEFVFVVQRGFLQILPVDLAQKKNKKKKKKEILRSNETGIIGTKKNKQESSSNFVITTWALSFSSVGSIRWIKIENLKGKKSNSRVYQKNFISDNEREFLSVQLSPPWFIEDLDEERAIVSIESPLARLFFFFVLLFLSFHSQMAHSFPPRHVRHWQRRACEALARRKARKKL